jgi:hypothetical protein
MELALEANRKGRMAIYPVLVGSETDGVYSPFRVSALKLESFPDNQSPTSPSTVKTTLTRLFKFQGIRLESTMPSEEILDSIANWTDDFAWNKKDTSLKVSLLIASLSLEGNSFFS